MVKPSVKPESAFENSHEQASNEEAADFAFQVVAALIARETINPQLTSNARWRKLLEEKQTEYEMALAKPW
jgi:hypothetical protein